MAASLFPPVLITITTFILCVSFVSSQNTGFTVDLIHRDASLPPSERISNAVRRSVNRIHRFNPTASSLDPNQVESTLTMDFGAYLIDLSIGTPPFPIKAIADTGSDLIWTQCKPCLGCYHQTHPLFDPRRSSTFKTLPCTSSLCPDLRGTCPETDTSTSCRYSIIYADASYSNGVLATETLTLNSTSGKAVPFSKTIFGCGFDNNGTFSKEASGIVGLGGGPESLIAQLEPSIDGKFSHCLVPIASQNNKTTSKMSFGANAVVSGNGTLSTAFFQGIDSKTFYYLSLEAISVGKTKIPFPGFGLPGREGNIIIDSGTTLTFLPPDFAADVKSAVQKAIGERRKVKKMKGIFTLCYESTVSDEFEAPMLTAHFGGGADVKLETLHTFVRISEDTVCFSLVESPPSAISIYGNLVQTNYLVGFDVKKHTVSFKPADCTKF